MVCAPRQHPAKHESADQLNRVFPQGSAERFVGLDVPGGQQPAAVRAPEAARPPSFMMSRAARAEAAPPRLLQRSRSVVGRGQRKSMGQ